MSGKDENTENFIILTVSDKKYDEFKQRCELMRNRIEDLKLMKDQYGFSKYESLVLDTFIEVLDSFDFIENPLHDRN